MLIDFFFHLKARRLPVSTTEYLSLLDALSAGLANYSLDDFYAISRICLVKSETHYDKFDLAFGDYFKKISVQGRGEEAEIPEEWLSAAASHLLSAEDYAMLNLAPQDTPQDEVRQPLLEDESSDDEGSKFLGGAGNNPLGHDDVHPDGARMESMNVGGLRAMKAWDSREFRGLDDEVELGTRNIKMALRRLRKFAREGVEDELDLDATIASTARNAGWLDLKMRPERRNKVKVLILFDVSGSMDSYVKQCEELFSAVRSEFKQLEYFYFRNCIGDSVWRYDGTHLLLYYPIHYLMHKYSKDYKLIIVGDASMAPVELLEAGDGYSNNLSQESGAAWLNRLLEHYKQAVWLNPEQTRYWKYTETIQTIRDIMEQRMYPLTLGGLGDAMRVLSK